MPPAESLARAREAVEAKLKSAVTQNPDEDKETSEADRADKLLELAAGGELDGPGQYVARDMAYKIAVEIGYPVLMIRSVVRQSNAYEIRAYELLLSGFQAIVDASHPAGVYRDVAREALDQSRRLTVQGYYALAKRMSGVAVAAAEKSKSKSWRKAAETADAAAAERSRMLDEAIKAEKTLTEKPDDQPANLAAGEFLCFLKQDWQRGLPHLAKAGDSKLAPLAERTIHVHRVSPGELLPLADAWWALAEAASEAQAEPMRVFAIKMYGAALGNLKPDDKTRVTVRIQDWAARHPIAYLRMTDAAEQIVAKASSVDSTRPSAPAKPVAANLRSYPPLDSRTSQHVRETIQAGKAVDTPRSGKSGTPFRDVADEGGLLVAIIIYWKDKAHTEACGIQPVYQTASGERRGAVYGLSGASVGWCAAGRGYALGGIRIPRGAVIEQSDVVMMRIDGLRLDPSATQQIRTRGEKGKESQMQVFALDGSLVVGITGTLAKDGSLAGLGLVTAP